MILNGIIAGKLILSIFPDFTVYPMKAGAAITKRLTVTLANL